MSLRLRPAYLLLPLLAACGRDAAPPSWGAPDGRPWPAPPEVAGAPPNFVVFLVDTLRADRLGCYGGPRPVSPRIDAFAREGVLFERAWAQAPYTATSHATLFTSTFPDSHGVWNKLDRKGGGQIFPTLNPKAFTLAEALTAAGYQTAAITDGGMLLPYRGLDQGFQDYSARFQGAAAKVDQARAWLRRKRDGRPFFLFVHTYQVHLPLMPDPAAVRRFDPDYQGPLWGALETARRERAARAARHAQPTVDEAINAYHRSFFKPHLADGKRTPEDEAFFLALYDAEIVAADAAFGRLLKVLDELGLREDTVVVLTSDHGEEFWEHGFQGHYKVYEECLHVPLVVRLPGGPRGLRRRDPVGLVDLMPTFLHLAGAPVPGICRGRILDLGRPGDVGRPFGLFGVSNWPREQMGYRLGNWKAVFHVDPPKPPEVYDLDRGLPERENLAETETEFLHTARRRLEDWRRGAREFGRQLGIRALRQLPGELGAEDRAELAELGYTED